MGRPLHKGRSEEPTTNIADFCNKIGTKLTSTRFKRTSASRQKANAGLTLRYVRKVPILLNKSGGNRVGSSALVGALGGTTVLFSLRLA